MATGVREIGEFDLTMEKAAKETGMSLTEFYARVTQNLELAKRLLTVALSVVFRFVTKIDRDMTGWTCVEPVDAEEDEFEPTLQEFLQEGESYVGGEEMVKRAKRNGALTGLRHAEAMLREQERIPVEWRKHVLVFAEVWQSPSGNRSVWYLDWDGERWYLSCDWLYYGFSSSDRLVVSRKYQKSLDS